jgi:hypothetical protein
MPDPFRLKVLKALTAALEEISVAGGYQTDLAGRVYRGRIIFGERDPIPMVSILEVPLPLDQLVSPRDSKDLAGGWDLMIQGFVEDDFRNPTDPAHVLMADVKRRLAQEKRRVNDGTAFGMREISNIRIGPGVVRPPDEVSAKAYFWLSLVIDMVEDLADPFA